VILLTAYASVETAVQAMQEGAFHFTNKPFDLDDVAFLVSRALETTQLRREVRRLRASQAQPYSVDRIVGQSTAMDMLRTLLAKVATSSQLLQDPPLHGFARSIQSRVANRGHLKSRHRPQLDRPVRRGCVRTAPRTAAPGARAHD
jgi:response regulator RpfG family c-di-GMP phosphodiesterase